MVATLALLALSASPVKVAATGLRAINLDPKLVQFYSEHLAQQLGYAGVQVTTQDQMTAVLGLERQKALLGCDEASCAAELAGALGVDGLLSGDVAKVIDTYQINVKVIAANDARVLASYAARTDDEEAVLNILTTAARALAKELYPKLERGPAPEPVAANVVTKGASVQRLAWIPAAAGVALIVVGVVTRVMAESAWSTLHPAPGATVMLSDATTAAATGKNLQLWSTVALAGGVACAAAAAAMFLFGGERSSLHAGIAVDPGGAAVVLAGRLP